MKVTSYLISQKLAEIGFNKPSNFMIKNDGKIIVAAQNKIIGKISSFSKPNKNGCDFLGDGYASYDLETLLNAIPDFLRILDTIAIKQFFLYFFLYHNSMGYCEHNDEFGEVRRNKKFNVIRKENESLADCAARLLIELHDQGLIKFGE